MNGTPIEYLRQWWICLLPNVKYVILFSSSNSTRIDDELVEILKKKIFGLIIEWNHYFDQLTQIINAYLSHIQSISFRNGHIWQDPQPRARFLLHLLPNLNPLLNMMNIVR